MNPLDARRRLLGRNVYKKTVEGNPAIAQGSLARRYPGITMQGWTTQDGTPTPETPVPIISAGMQNQDTGKWGYEITIANAQTDPDKNQTVLITSDRPLTKWDRLEKRDGQWGWVYKSVEKQLEPDYPGVYYNGQYFNIDGFLQADTGKMEESLCEYLKYDVTHKKNKVFWIDSVGTGLRIKIDDITSVEDLRMWLSENSVVFLYPRTEETFVPLSTSEQEQMNALYTFRPTTVLSNDCGCNMTLTYKTKKSLEVTD